MTTGEHSVTHENPLPGVCCTRLKQSIAGHAAT